MKIAFHDNSLSLRGTTVALFDYAFFNQEILGNESIIIHDLNHQANNLDVFNKFSKHFKVYSYSNFDLQFDKVIESEKCDASFFIKCGQHDGKLSKASRNLINAIGVCQLSDVHGDVFAMGSKWLSKVVDYKIPSVPYMVNLPKVNGDFRSALNIPHEATVFGRNGGRETFDIQFVKDAVLDVVSARDDIFFLFQFTDKFCEHPRVKFLDGSPDLEHKVKFMNTCDAMLHARIHGESFGLSCAEFSWQNKRIITYFDSVERNHIEVLGENGLYYRDYNSVREILLNFKKEAGDFNFYKEYSPQNIMKQFREVYGV